MKTTWSLVFVVASYLLSPKSTAETSKALVHLDVQMFLSCRHEAGYVLTYRLTNAGSKTISIPSELLPWSPSLGGLNIRLKSAKGDVITSMAAMAELSGSIDLKPQQESFGEIRLSMLYSGAQIQSLFAEGDAVLQWNYKIPLDNADPQTAKGEAYLLGKSFYKTCLLKGA